MKVLLIQPPYPFSEFPKPSSALMFLGTVLRREGAEVEVLDLLSTRYTPQKIEERLNRFQPDIVGATSVTLNFPMAVKILQHCKAVDPEVTAIMGGPHVTFTAEETLRSFPQIDIIVRGEGEETLTELVFALRDEKSLEPVRGLTFRHNGRILRTADRPFIEDLDLLPLPDRTLFPISRYLAMHVPASVLSSRGCPMDCTFCVGYRMIGRRGRFRSPLRVVEEIEHAYRLGFQEVCIDDDLFTRNRKHVTAICDEIVRRGLKMKMYIFARVDTVDADLLRKLKEAGVAMICFGLESGNQRILDLANKRTTVETARKAVHLAKEAGISCLGSFIIGLPGETRETMQETIAFAQSLGIPHGFHLLSPFPGTQIRERAAEFGLKILTHDWVLYDADHAVTETEALSAAEVENYAQSFFGHLTAQVEDMKKGILAGTYTGPYRDEMEKRLEVDFAWKILSADLLEEQGSIPGAEALGPDPQKDSLPVLARRLAGTISLPLPFIESKLQKLSNRGLIVGQGTTDSFRWRWKDP